MQKKLQGEKTDPPIYTEGNYVQEGSRSGVVVLVVHNECSCCAGKNLVIGYGEQVVWNTHGWQRVLVALLDLIVRLV